MRPRVGSTTAPVPSCRFKQRCLVWATLKVLTLFWGGRRGWVLIATTEKFSFGKKTFFDTAFSLEQALVVTGFFKNKKAHSRIRGRNSSAIHGFPPRACMSEAKPLWCDAGTTATRSQVVHGGVFDACASPHKRSS